MAWAIVLLVLPAPPALSLFFEFFAGPFFVMSATVVVAMAYKVDEIPPDPVTSFSPREDQSHCCRGAGGASI